ncbi:VTT domain-containing protein [Winkia sp. UMB3158]|uniref:VTT domain-containing protein n=2 Tax=Winkia neuii TaxID=33007 RepID=K0ZCH4_9ACTO|nr:MULTISPECIES: VTT domain-containing protein [Winkia]MDK8340360.1 VTT domain-containing protein [Winkia sp. UMB3164B]PLB80180.1 alkaline phosphatase [Actinomyces sp. UMB0138]EJZ85150.1 hypothetical protein HMPREF9240_01637 [Winkia neuii BV029A5]MDK7148912.1 VTT domain-containing protein [Winkia sp. UMB3158]MDK7905867.1 VTT domain-containing protein [Winkia sp. UMB0889B]
MLQTFTTAAAGLSTGLIDYLRDPEELLLALGPYVLIGVAVIVFIESGLLFPFLPGDSLLFTAGLLHSQLGLNFWLLISVVIVAAVGGDQAGYWIGREFGRKLFKPNARVLKTEYLEEAEAFFDKWGGPALTLGRFVPIVRTFIPVTAGMARMHYPHFFRWNVIGGIAWGGGMCILGVWLGQIPAVRNNIEIMAVLVVLISVVPIIIGFLRKRAQKKSAQ